jgi:hypothetical protein
LCRQGIASRVSRCPRIECPRFAALHPRFGLGLRGDASAAAGNRPDTSKAVATRTRQCPLSNASESRARAARRCPHIAPQPSSTSSGSIRNARSFRICWRRRAAVQSAALAVTSAADSDGNRSAAAPFRRIIDDAYRAVISSGHETTQIFRIII